MGEDNLDNSTNRPDQNNTSKSESPCVQNSAELPQATRKSIVQKLQTKDIPQERYTKFEFDRSESSETPQQQTAAEKTESTAQNTETTAKSAGTTTNNSSEAASKDSETTSQQKERVNENTGKSLDQAERGEVVPKLTNSNHNNNNISGDSEKKYAKKRDLISFWILACCNNFGYTLLLTAAHDILHDSGHYPTEAYDDNVTLTRSCNLMSTGSILLADALPGLFIKIIAPFFPASEHLRMIATVILYASGLFLVAFSPTIWIAILGTAITSASNGFGEVTCLSHSPYYPRGVLGAWSSGLAASGLLASMTLAGMTFFGFTPRMTLKIMLFVPLLMAFTFWFILSKPDKPNRKKDVEENITKTLVTSSTDKLKALPGLMKYMLPTSSVYLFQYFINQGLSELIQFDNISMDQGAQYRWIQVSYQTGKFIAQSSRSLIKINKVWFLVALQFLNIIFFSCEVVFYITPFIAIIFMVSFWEGLVGGSTYLNVVRKVSVEVPPNKQDFALVMCSLSDSIGVTISGFLSIPVHNLICRLPKPERWTY